MPRFYFHIHDGRDQFDTDGVDLPDAATAQVEAVRLAGAALRDEARQVARGGPWDMEVTDAAGVILFRLGFSLATAGAVGGAVGAGMVRSPYGP